MQKSLAWAGFILLLASLTTFVVLSARSLPPLVVTHFAADGSPNGAMSRAGYLSLILLLQLALPLLLAVLPGWLASKGGLGLNIPNRDYWLMPERLEQTIAWLGGYGKLFAALLTLFISYLHWLLLGANTHLPVALPLAKVLTGLAIYLALVAWWSFALNARFRRTDAPPA